MSLPEAEIHGGPFPLSPQALQRAKGASLEDVGVHLATQGRPKKARGRFSLLSGMLSIRELLLGCASFQLCAFVLYRGRIKACSGVPLGVRLIPLAHTHK